MKMQKKIDKALILHIVIEKLHEDLHSLKMSLERTQEGAVEAPSAMQSHSDKTKFELHTQAMHQRETIDALQGTIRVLEKLKQTIENDGTKETIKLGSLFEIQEIGGKIQWYFMLPEAGGTKILYKDAEITIITPHTPISAFFLDKKQGSTDTLKRGELTKEFEIKSII